MSRKVGPGGPTTQRGWNLSGFLQGQEVSAPIAPGLLYPKPHSRISDYSMDDSSLVTVDKLLKKLKTKKGKSPEKISEAGEYPEMHRAHHTSLTSGSSGAGKPPEQSKEKETVVGTEKIIKRNNPSSGPELGSRSSLLLEESTTLEQSESFLPGLFFFDNLVEINNHLLL